MNGFGKYELGVAVDSVGWAVENEMIESEAGIAVGTGGRCGLCEQVGVCKITYPPVAAELQRLGQDGIAKLGCCCLTVV